jgi:hypothetical protein
MIEYIKSFEFTSTLALMVYWIPLAICAIVYFFRVIRLYKIDLEKRHHSTFYIPTLTVGLIVQFIVCTITPCVNLLALVFDCASSVFIWFGKVLDIPLVPKQK